MDDSDDNVPVVVLDDDGGPPPQRRFPGLWSALAGAFLLATLGAVALFYGRRPSPPPPVPSEAMACADADPVPLDEPSAPVELAKEVPPAAPPPIPPLPPASASPAPASTSPRTEVAVLAEEPSPVVEETSGDPLSPAPEEDVAEVQAPVPTAPTREGSPSIEKDLGAAAAAISDATPLFVEIADRFDPPAFRNGDVCELAAKMDRVEEKLREAQRIYAQVKDRAPDPRMLDQRLEMIGDLLDSLKDARARIRVPFALRRAEVLQEEAVPLAKEALDGFQPFSREATVLDVRADVAAGKLREARRLYISIRNDVPDPEVVDQRVKSVDSLLEDLDGRYPQVRTAH